MKSKKEYIKLLQGYFEKTARKYGVTRMALFGSVARGEQLENSDIDIAYEGQPDLFIRVRMKMELENLFDCKVDIIRLREDFSGTIFGEELSKDLIYV